MRLSILRSSSTRRALVRANAAASDLLAAGYSQHALDTILRERFRLIPGLRTLDDLTARELVQVSMTLTRLKSWKPDCNASEPPLQDPISKTPPPSQIALFGEAPA